MNFPAIVGKPVVVAVKRDGVVVDAAAIALKVGLASVGVEGVAVAIARAARFSFSYNPAVVLVQIYQAASVGKAMAA